MRETDRQTEGQTKRQRSKSVEWAGRVCVCGGVGGWGGKGRGGGGEGRDLWNQMNQSLFKGVFSGFLADLVKAISFNN